MNAGQYIFEIRARKGNEWHIYRYTGDRVLELIHHVMGQVGRSGFTVRNACTIVTAMQRQIRIKATLDAVANRIIGEFHP